MKNLQNLKSMAMRLTLIGVFLSSVSGAAMAQPDLSGVSVDQAGLPACAQLNATMQSDGGLLADTSTVAPGSGEAGLNPQSSPPEGLLAGTSTQAPGSGEAGLNPQPVPPETMVSGRQLAAVRRIAACGRRVGLNPQPSPPEGRNCVVE
jgi:hypothetical protein